MLFDNQKLQLVTLVPFEEGPIFSISDVTASFSRVWYVPTFADLDDEDDDDDEGKGRDEAKEPFTVLLADSTLKSFSRLFLYEIGTHIEEPPTHVDTLTFISTEPKTFFFDSVRGFLFLLNRTKSQPNCFIVKMKKEEKFDFSRHS